MKKNKIIMILILALILFLPNTVLAEANFDDLLTDGKLVINSIKPTSDEMAYSVIYEYGIMDKYPNYYVNFDSPCNADYSKCTIYYGNHNPETDPHQEVEMSWVYDENVKTVVDSLINKIGNQDTFALNEIEFINYLLNLSEDSSMINYSSELRKILDYKNFSIDVRLGDDSFFYTERGGNAVFSYNDTIYYIKPMTIAQAKHIIYVDSNTTDVLSAVKERLIKIFGTDFNVVEKDTITNYLESERQRFISQYNPSAPNSNQYSSADEYASEMMNLEYYNEDAYYHFITDTNIYEKYYTLTINNKEVNFLVIKNSTKVNNNINLITTDVGSNITISTTSNSLPLDTLINVAKLTNGEEYEKIVNILNKTNIEMYDLKLFSQSTGNYITKLDDGTFEVKLPIKEELKGKDLIVYYVDDNNKIVEYEVTIENDFAKFNTNHFSIYSLTEKTNATIEQNPQTYNGIITFIILGILSLIVFVITIIYFKKNSVKDC